MVCGSICGVKFGGKGELPFLVLSHFTQIVAMQNEYCTEVERYV